MRRWLVGFLLLALIGSATAQQIAIIDPQLEAQLLSLEAWVSQTRGLAEKETVTLFFPTREETRAYLENSVAESMTPDLVAEAMLSYRAFDFLEEDLDLVQLYLDLLGQQVAGYYDPATQYMNVILSSGEQPGNELPLLDQIVFVHEYTHALQDQYFGLEAFYDEEIEGDSLLARQALVEGDATYIMNLYTIEIAQDNPFGALADILSSGLEAGNMALPPETPPILGAELLFPYEQGSLFAEALIEAGGWEKLNDAFTNPPVSTEQIIHPEKYLAGENPIAVSLPDNAAVLGADWTLGTEGVLGEFYLRQYLQTQLRRNPANAAAAGWGGDWYHIYTHENGDLAWALSIAWDSAEEQAEFESTYEDFIAKRLPEATVSDGCYEGAELTLCVRSTEAGTLITSAPTLEQAWNLLTALLVPA